MSNSRSRRRKPRGKSGGSSSSRQWRRMDLHLHTPGSSDYQESNASYLDILRQAEIRGLDIIAFTDHNTVAGFAAMRKEVEQLLWLEELGRLDLEEQRRLDEYRRLLEKILVLPGFEFTATFGFHILGIFPQDTPISFLEHLLLTLRVPLESLSQGSATVGATADVLTAYRVINEAGGIVIAAHANSSNGVAMRGLDFGGQTRIAYTQDPNLHVLEVTDLEKRGRYTTRRFFDGSKPEYPRAMRCIQGSDAHRLLRESPNSKSLGVGDRVTEILLREVSFEALAEVLKGSDLSLTRPYRGPANPIDFVQLAREEGESIVQSFHASMAQRGGHQNRVLRDVCAMSNGNGGTIYIGVSANPKEKPVGVRDHNGAIERLQTAVSNKLTPEPNVHIDNLPSQGKQIVRITVLPGQDKPYAIEDNLFYIRDDTETSLAVRDEIVRLVHTGHETSQAEAALPPLPPIGQLAPKITDAPSKVVETPRTGVEIVKSEKRKGTYYHTVRDLRNGNLIKNVTRSSARKLWHYAITKVEENGAPKAAEIAWQGNIAVLHVRKKNDNVWYDLAMREGDTIHYFYGVTDSGLNENWLSLIEKAQ
ncbi:RNA-binding domain-containing protein [Candidatus Leptofilum sp.]|uniref:RNA-binding domain-containing protein n=1 Tax=Candidatus Leptofilum sp. TaxID=3241576 RepID=UPI003B593D69